MVLHKALCSPEASELQTNLMGGSGKQRDCWKDLWSVLWGKEKFGPFLMK